MDARIEKGNLVITIPLGKPRPSSSGKTILLATTKGPRKTSARFEGKTVAVVANAFLYPDA